MSNNKNVLWGWSITCSCVSANNHHHNHCYHQDSDKDKDTNTNPSERSVLRKSETNQTFNDNVVYLWCWLSFKSFHSDLVFCSLSLFLKLKFCWVGVGVLVFITVLVVAGTCLGYIQYYRSVSSPIKHFYAITHTWHIFLSSSDVYYTALTLCSEIIVFSN